MLTLDRLEQERVARWGDMEEGDMDLPSGTIDGLDFDFDDDEEDDEVGFDDEDAEGVDDGEEDDYGECDFAFNPFHRTVLRTMFTLTPSSPTLVP